MEVHHHPQLHHQPKPWKEYLLEGLMIFVAVSMGFIAENIREHFSDKAKEKEYIHSLIQDFKVDTAIINGSIVYNRNVKLNNVTFLKLLKEYKKDSASLAQIAKYFNISGNFSVSINDPKTYEQLKSTGEFKLIKNKKVFDSVSAYYEEIATIKTWADELQSTLISNYTFGAKVVDFSVVSLTDSMGNFKVHMHNSYLQTLKPSAEIDSYRFEYINRLIHFTIGLQEYEMRLGNIKKQIISLVALLQKEYNLQNE